LLLVGSSLSRGQRRGPHEAPEMHGGQAPPRHTISLRRLFPSPPSDQREPFARSLKDNQASAQLRNAEGPSRAVSLQFPPSRSQWLPGPIFSHPFAGVKGRGYSHVRRYPAASQERFFSRRSELGGFTDWVVAPKGLHFVDTNRDRRLSRYRQKTRPFHSTRRRRGYAAQSELNRARAKSASL